MPRPKLTESQKGRRLNGHITTQATEVLDKIKEDYGTSDYATISTALVFYHKAMHGDMPFIQVSAHKSKNRPRKEDGQRSLNALKTIWCEEVGGTVDGNVCHLDKYEMTMAGTVESDKRSIPISELPDTKEDLISYALGGFKTLKEAKDAAEISARKDAKVEADTAKKEAIKKQ